MKHLRPFRLRKGGSAQRSHLQTAVIEGIPATLIANLIGGPILTGYLLFLGANSQQIGIVLAIPPLANLSQIVAAYLMQRMENRKLWMMMCGIIHRVLWTLTGLIPFLLPSTMQVPVFVFLFFSSFISGAIGGVIWSSLISDMVPAQIRGRYFGIRNTIHLAFGSVGLLAAGQILEHMPEKLFGFAILFGICGLLTIWNGIELKRYPNPPFEKSTEKSGFGAFLRPVRDRTFMLVAGFIAIFILVFNAAVPLFSFVMLDILGVSYTLVTVVTTVQMATMMLAFYVWGNLNARIDSMTLLLWSLPIMALCCVLWIGLEFLPLLLVLLLVHIALGVGQGGFNLLSFNYLIGDTPKADRPMYIAFFQAFSGITGFVGPLIGGWVYKQISGGPMWIQSYGVSVMAGVIMLVLALGAGPIVLNQSKKARKRAAS